MWTCLIIYSVRLIYHNCNCCCKRLINTNRKKILHFKNSSGTSNIKWNKYKVNFVTWSRLWSVIRLFCKNVRFVLPFEVSVVSPSLALAVQFLDFVFLTSNDRRSGYKPSENVAVCFRPFSRFQKISLHYTENFESLPCDKADVSSSVLYFENHCFLKKLVIFYFLLSGNTFYHTFVALDTKSLTIRFSAVIKYTIPT